MNQVSSDQNEIQKVKPTKTPDITGKRFERLTVLYYGKNITEKKVRNAWRCRCHCGKEVWASPYALNKGLAKSCGCWLADWSRKHNKKHGCYSHPAYKTWGNIRTANTRDGLYVCPEWLERPDAFIAWADAQGFKKGYFLRRIDSAEGFFPDNCVVLPMEKAKKIRKGGNKNTSGYTGVHKRYLSHSVRWQAVRFNTSLGYYDTKKEALDAVNAYVDSLDIPLKKEEYRGEDAGTKTSLGAFVSKTVESLAGQTFGRWTVLRRVSDPDKRLSYWLCRCSCGEEATLSKYHLTKGKSLSCGCLAAEVTSKRMTVHGLTTLDHTDPMYAIWAHMRSLCSEGSDSRTAGFIRNHNIKICEEWEDPVVFVTWARSAGGRKGMSFIRKDPYKDFTPDNCMFTEDSPHSAGVAASGRRSTNTSGYTGVGQYNNVATRIYYSVIMVDGKRISLGRFDTKREALFVRNKYIAQNKLPHTIQEYRGESPGPECGSPAGER